MLKGCATPALCNLPVNSTLGPKAFGFHLTAWPECYREAPPTQPGASDLDPLCPLWIPLALPKPVCSQGIPSLLR